MRGSVSWQQRGRCRDLDSELFYPPLDSESLNQRHARELAAKAVCAACPVRAECLAWALATDERHGVWGGKNERERQALAGHRRQLRQRVTTG
ncbi:MAG TPA: WhiB family transcriptional regulator [Euzebyales bacterium]|nr:WhiB family transcriptional regulator [Euzebyales bacterium]